MLEQWATWDTEGCDEWSYYSHLTECSYLGGSVAIIWFIWMILSMLKHHCIWVGEQHVSWGSPGLTSCWLDVTDELLGTSHVLLRCRLEALPVPESQPRWESQQIKQITRAQTVQDRQHGSFDLSNLGLHGNWAVKNEDDVLGDRRQVVRCKEVGKETTMYLQKHMIRAAHYLACLLLALVSHTTDYQ